MSITKEGWMVKHPTTNKMVEVVNAEYIICLERQIQELKLRLDSVKAVLEVDVKSKSTLIEILNRTLE